MTPFCYRHTISFLSGFELSSQPLDLALSKYFRIHKSLGASDRRMMGDLIFGMIRWKGLINWLCPHQSVQKRLDCYQNLNWEQIALRNDIPIGLRLGVPPFLYENLRNRFGEEETKNLCQILNKPAPITIRTNLIKTTRDHLFEKWAEKFSIEKCSTIPEAIHFNKREPLFSLPEFKEGLFEMQDVGSQMIASLVAIKPGDLFLDFCSGSGGKSLAIAPKMKGKGQIFLHDIRPQALLEAKKRLRRAGIQNAQCTDPDHPQLKKLIGKCDWVLIDVPCSGTGTLRRNPDQKWKIDASSLERLIPLQKEIIKKAVPYVKPGGRLVYATCSLLAEENEMQAEWIAQQFPLNLETPPLFLKPQEKGSDGFFGAVFLN